LDPKNSEILEEGGVTVILGLAWTIAKALCLSVAIGKRLVGMILPYKNRNFVIDFTNWVFFKAFFQNFYTFFIFSPIFYLKI